VYAAALCACEQGGESKLALELLSEMGVNNVDPIHACYCTVLRVCEKGGEWCEVLQLLQQMFAATIVLESEQVEIVLFACA